MSEPVLQAGRRVLARALGELLYEGALTATETRADGKRRQCEVRLPSGAVYRFEAWRSIWGGYDVEAASIGCADGSAPDCFRFFVDARTALGLGEITAGHLLEEIHNTVFAEAEQRRRLAETDVRGMADLSGIELDGLLDAHPKAIGNRGRLGWGAPEIAAYAPEFSPSFPLRFIGVRAASANQVFAPRMDTRTLLASAMSEDHVRALLERAVARGLDPEIDALMPVHPWQWDRYIRMQYAHCIESGDIVDLGAQGDRFRPQQSIRTLSNVDRPGTWDVKLSLSILNTSSYRGIPAKFAREGVAISTWAQSKVEHDRVLCDRVVVRRDVAAAWYAHPNFSRIEGAPYRYHEMLAAIWRESSERCSRLGEMVVPMAALYQTDHAGEPLLGEYVRRSGLSLQAWLTELFDRVVVPLYHWLCAHGVGVVAHGQNIGLVLSGYRPRAMVLKDFHGDVRLSDLGFASHDDLPRSAASALPRLPASHLVHDLFTGHFVTVLRFVSSLAERKFGFGEGAFYQTLASVLRAYQAHHPELAARFAAFDLFRPTMERLCINRSRFRIGYADSDERPLLDLGPALDNPLSEHAPS
jgi:aerobactin synthase